MYLLSGILLFFQRAIYMYLTPQVLGRFSHVIPTMHPYWVWSLVTSISIWRYPGFLETMHPSSRPCFLTYTSSLLFKQIRVICAQMFNVWMLYPYVISYWFLWLPLFDLFLGTHTCRNIAMAFFECQVSFNLFADCGVWLNSSAHFRTFIWTVKF